ncbi:hypothetical protein [Roseiflexus castenholzii]|uniref:hypothetical protein n=1 Tax=Roseiflexus castenholzii TaxID=120962 RepID=UPI0002F987A0|nr:hypothetical protein [Roseiflexus castenholzii]
MVLEETGQPRVKVRKVDGAGNDPAPGVLMQHGGARQPEERGPVGSAQAGPNR